MWLRFIEDYKYNGKLIFKKGALEFINRVEFAEYLVENRCATPKSLPINE